MARQTVSITQDFSQPLGTVFEFLSKPENLGPLYGVPIKRIVDAKDPGNPNGVGSVRRMRIGPVAVEETITKFEKNSLIEYRVTKGGFLKHQLGTMRFSEHDGKATLDYTIEVESQIPFGTLPLKLALQSAIGGALRKYAARS